eukprot:scaffold3943_cov123-Isochrysis_galbana.AAC.4
MRAPLHLDNPRTLERGGHLSGCRLEQPELGLGAQRVETDPAVATRQRPQHHGVRRQPHPPEPPLHVPAQQQPARQGGLGLLRLLDPLAMCSPREPAGAHALAAEERLPALARRHSERRAAEHLHRPRATGAAVAGAAHIQVACRPTGSYARARPRAGDSRDSRCTEPADDGGTHGKVLF